MRDIIQSVYEWNELRFPQEFSESLANELLAEEYGELVEAKNNSDTVETLDALGDIIYVALGNLWKLHTPVDEALDLIDNSDPTHSLSRMLGTVPMPMGNSPILFMMDVIVNALDEMNILVGVSDSLKILRAICASNNTKAVDRVDADTKANKDKGSEYVPPTEAIEAIVKSHVNLAEYMQDIQKSTTVISVSSSNAVGENVLADFVKFDLMKSRVDLLPEVAMMYIPRSKKLFRAWFRAYNEDDLNQLMRLGKRIMKHTTMLEVGMVLAYGAQKYSADNWRKVDNLERYWAALGRHLDTMDANPDSLDEESSWPHAAHAMCCVLFIQELWEQFHDPVIGVAKV